MVGAGSLIRPLLGLPDMHYGSLDVSFAIGVVVVGVIVILIVVTAGMVSTTWVQFIKGSLLVLFYAGAITLALFSRGLTAKPAGAFPRILSAREFNAQLAPGDEVLTNTGEWAKFSYARVKHADGSLTVWRFTGMQRLQLSWPAATFSECQIVSVTKDGTLLNDKPRSLENDLKPAGFITNLPSEGEPEIDKSQPRQSGDPSRFYPRESSGKLGPVSFLTTVQGSDMGVPRAETVKDAKGTHTIYYSQIIPGEDILLPGQHPTLFKGIKTGKTSDRLNFISFMLALFCGTAALPHILIRYYTVKNQASARKSTVVGIATIGLFYVLTLYLGLGAMTSGALEPDPAYNQLAAPLLAKSFGELTFAFISAVAFTTVLGTVSGLIIAASGAVAHDLLHSFLKLNLDDHEKVRAGKIASLVVGVIAIILGILFQKMNPAFLVAWAFNIAASANLPAITMLLFWRGTTKQGITASIIVGLVSSLAWILLSTDAYVSIYGKSAALSPVPFNQPAIVTIPLAYVTLIVVSLVTQKRAPVAVYSREAS